MLSLVTTAEKVYSGTRGVMSSNSRRRLHQPIELIPSPYRADFFILPNRLILLNQTILSTNNNTHSYYNLVYSLAGYSLLILTSFISPQSNYPLPSCNPSHGTCCSALGLCFLWQTSPWCQPHLLRTADDCRCPYHEQCSPHQDHRYR